MSEVNWENAPEDAEYCIDGEFIKWADGDEYKFHASWDRECTQWSLEKYIASEVFEIEKRPEPQLDKTACATSNGSITANGSKSDGSTAGRHYDNYAEIKLSADELISGVAVVKIDPHFVSRACGMNGGVMEHIFKKAMRGISKGHSAVEVFEEIILLANRGIELEELLK